MTDMEYIRMRQEEGPRDAPERGTIRARPHRPRLAALLWLPRRPRDRRPAGRLQRQP